MGFLSEEFTGTRILKHEEELVIIKHVGNLLALGNVILKLFENMFKKLTKDLMLEHHLGENTVFC